MISTRNRDQIEMAKAKKKVEGSASHWFALCFEITKAP